MKKKQFIFIFSSILSVTVLLIALGVIFNKTEAEKLDGLTDLFDVSVNETIAYVYLHEGKPTIYMKTDAKEEIALQLSEEKELLDITFSPDGTILYYSETDIENKKELKSTVYVLDVRSFDTKILFEDPSLITEVVIDPKDEQKMFYLKAKTFENYSPIARENPHDYDIYSYHMEHDKHEQHTALEHYAMQSLHISYTDDIAYVQMNDDFDAETADELFETNQRIFQIPLDDPSQMTTLTDPKREIDIFDFALIPNQHALIFQSISNYNAGGNFEYDLYYYDWNTTEEQRITNLESYAGRPTFSRANDLVYFIYDDNFAKGKPNYSLYSMDINGENITEIPLHP